MNQIKFWFLVLITLVGSQTAAINGLTITDNVSENGSHNIVNQNYVSQCCDIIQILGYLPDCQGITINSTLDNEVSFNCSSLYFGGYFVKLQKSDLQLNFEEMISLHLMLYDGNHKNYDLVTTVFMQPLVIDNSFTTLYYNLHSMIKKITCYEITCVINRKIKPLCSRSIHNGCGDKRKGIT